jgi:hypothetical protein
VHDARGTADTTVGLSSVEQVSGLEPLDGGSGIGGENAPAHGASALVLGVHGGRHSDGGRKAGQTVQVRALIGHGSLVGSFSSGHFVGFENGLVYLYFILYFQKII